MSADPHTQPGWRRVAMRHSVLDGCAFAVMLGFGQEYFQAFAMAVNGGERVASSLLAFTPLLGAIVQLITPTAIEKLGSHKRLVVIVIATQALTFVPLAVGAYLGVLPIALLIAANAVYWFAGLAGGAGWSTWMATVVPKRVRPHYFSFRTRLLWFFTLASTLLAGGVLMYAQKYHHELLGFGILFSVATIARSISAWHLSRVAEPTPIPPGHRHVHLAEAFSKLLHGNDGRLMGYLMSVAFALNVSQPFLIPWLLGPLENPTETAALFGGALTAGRIVALYAMGGVIRRFGPKRLLMVSGCACIPVPLLFLLSKQLEPILVVQFVAGFFLAGYDMSQWLLMIEHTDERERTSMFSTAYLFNIGLAPTIGWLVGLAILVFGGFRVGVTEPPTYSYQGYATVFVVGTALRLLTLVPMFVWVRRLPGR